MQLRSIQLKIALLAGICLLVTAGALVGYGLVFTQNTQQLVAKRVVGLMEKEAERNLASVAQAQAAFVQSALQENLDAARTLAFVFEVLQSSEAARAAKTGTENPVRNVISDILYNVLQNNPKFLGSYTAWEPNALDGRDAAFSGKTTDGYDGSGRFIPYWNRDEHGKIAKQALVDYENQAKYDNGIRKGGWYLGPRESGKESVLDPFPYLIQGKREWLTTLSVPIKKNNKFLGVAGTDLRLNFLQDLAKEVDGHLYNGQGDVLIISYEGMIVASSKDPKTIGQPLHAIFPQSAQAVLKIVQEGKPMVDVSASSGLMRAFGPVKLGRTGKPWCVLLRVSPKIVLAQAQELDAELAQRTHDASYWQVGVGLGVTVLAIAVLWLFSATLVKPLRQAAAFADGVAHGDFSQTLHIQQQDEIGVLAGALQTMVSNLKDMIGQADAKSREAEEEAEHARQAVAEAEKARQEAAMAQRQGMLAAAQKLEGVVERITSASEQLSAQVEQSKKGADLQSQHAGETATSMEEMNATVLEVAKNASQAAEGSDEAKSKAQAGAEVVRQAVEAINTVQRHSENLATQMDELGKQAQGIGQIINVISDIADQTNLLALNAAIEAARAGEAGRGFAVVADEVRKLAEKTMTATNEVGQAIREIQAGAKASIDGMGNASKAVDEATKLAGESGKMLEEIVSIVESSADQVRSIATASEQQSAASEEINRAVDRINQISNETAEAMGQSTEAVGELAEQAQALQGLINELKED